MEEADLRYDPIIQLYEKLCNDQQDDAAVDGVFSSVRLTFAIREILGRNNVLCLQAGDIENYKKLLLLFYAEKFNTKDASVLYVIMNQCYDVTEIHKILHDNVTRQEIIEKWKLLQKKRLLDAMYNSTVRELIREWHYRLLQSGGNFDMEILENKFDEAMQFLNWHYGHRGKFIKALFRLLSNQNVTKKSLRNNVAADDIATAQSLDIPTIYESIKHNLNAWLVRTLALDSSRSRRIGLTNEKPLKLKAALHRNQMSGTTEVQIKQSKSRTKTKSKKRKIIIEVEETVLKQPPPTPPPQAIEEPAADETKAVVNATVAHETTQYADKYLNVIDKQTAMAYIEELKLYALSNERFEALDPLEQVESCFL